jgi:hypothetical protein
MVMMVWGWSCCADLYATGISLDMKFKSAELSLLMSQGWNNEVLVVKGMYESREMGRFLSLGWGLRAMIFESC